ncbi:MAG: hypothetical protein WC334_03245 [Kiritimatiellales bacterium]
MPKARKSHNGSFGELAPPWNMIGRATSPTEPCSNREPIGRTSSSNFDENDSELIKVMQRAMVP